MITGAGMTDYAKKARDAVYALAPWEVEDHWTIYDALHTLVDEVDPELIILDNMLAPAKDLAGNTDRKFVSLCPNAVLDLTVADQPRGGMFWKYPASFAGYPFPIPWKLKPANIFLSIHLVWHLVTSPILSAKRKFLVDKGIPNPIELSFAVKDIPILATTMKEASIPMDFYPPYITFCGPVTLSRTLNADENLPIMKWLRQAPTILINLGSLFAYNERRARIMADALAAFLAGTKDYQVLWKANKLSDYGDEVFASVQPQLDSGRVRIKKWLEMEPMTMLETGHIVLSVHHGGQTRIMRLSSGVPQMILPLWFDLYNIANTAEYLGIGIWADRKTTPEWEVKGLAEGFRTVLIGPRHVSLRETARELGQVARQYDGTRTVAAEIAKMAAITD